MAGLNSVNGIPSGGQGIGITKERLAAFNCKYGTYTDKTMHPDGMEMFKIASAGPGSVRQMEPRTVSWLEKAVRWVKSLFVKDTTMQETSRTFYEDVSRAFGGAEHIPQNVKAAIGEHCNVEGVEKPLLLSQVRNVQSLASQALDRKNAEFLMNHDADLSDEVRAQAQEEHYDKLTPEEKKDVDREEKANVFYGQQNHGVNEVPSYEEPKTPLKQALAEQGPVNKEVFNKQEDSVEKKVSTDRKVSVSHQILKERYTSFGDTTFVLNEEREIANGVCFSFNADRARRAAHVTDVSTPKDASKWRTFKLDKDKEPSPFFTPRFGRSGSVGNGVPKPGVDVPKTEVDASHPDVKRLTDEEILRQIEALKSTIGDGLLLDGSQSEGGIYVDVNKALEAIKKVEEGVGKEFVESRCDKAMLATNVLQKLYGNSLEGLSNRVPLLGANAAKEIQEFFLKGDCAVGGFRALINKLKGDESEAIVKDTNSVQHAENRFKIVQNVLLAYVFGVEVK